MNFYVYYKIERCWEKTVSNNSDNLLFSSAAHAQRS